MIKDNQKAFHRIHIIIDGLLMAGSYLFAYLLRFDVLTFFSVFALAEDERYYPLEVYASYLIYLIPGLMILYSACGLYRPKRGRSRRLEFWNILRANFFGLFYFTFILNFVKREANFSRGFMLLFFCINIAASLLFRYSLDNVLRAARRRGFNLKHVLIVGYSRAAERYIDRIRANPQWGYYIYGILDDEMEKGTQYRKIPVIGSTYELERLIAENSFDEIAITLCMREYDRLEQIAAICEKSGIHTKFIPDYRNIIPTIPCIEDLDGLPVINIRNVPLSLFGNRIVKRCFDVVGSIFCILLFSIPMLLVAGLIKLTSPGPVIFKQTRVGLHNKEFRMYKFRTMAMQPERTEALAWTTSHDTRVTGIGKFLRRTSIDELPQLFNVLIGNMSLVGPRPERPFFVEKFKEEIPRYMIKHQVRPGMTGWAQVNGYRGDTSITKRIECDLYYIENWTLGLDIKILFLTLFRGFINRNAY